jgi:predicted nuclease of predicted toxin-antitoxin system
MVKILLDECLPRKLKYRIDELDDNFTVKTVQDAGWDSFSDGKILANAEKKFDVVVTSDRNLQFQQPIGDKNIHVLLLVASTNTYEDLLPLMNKLKPFLIRKPGHLAQIK